MPSPLKRPSLGRLLPSLRPSRESSFPVQTGFPTSLADLVVRNHGRLRKPRKPRRPTAALVPCPSPVAPPVILDDFPQPPPEQPRSTVAVRRLDALQGGGAAVRLSPQFLALGGTVALALLAVWSEGTVAAFTVAALSLHWIESASRRRRHPGVSEALPDSCISPIRDVDEAPRRSNNCSDSDRGSEAPSPRTAHCCELFAGDDPTTPKLKAKRLLRKLISKKKRESKNSSVSSRSFEQPDAAAGDTEIALKTESLVSASESSTEWSSFSSSLSESAAVVVVDRRGPGVKFPLSAFIPVILTGLAAGKLPATALAVLCIVFSSVVQRLQ